MRRGGINSEGKPGPTCPSPDRPGDGLGGAQQNAGREAGYGSIPPRSSSVQARYGAEKPSPFDPCAQSHSAPLEASARSLLNSASSRTTRSFVSATPTIAPVSQASYVSYITTV